jgi:2-oxoglutarate ferredoxin oxidoreductase subunit alpha
MSDLPHSERESMADTDIVVRFAGEAGDGVNTLGDTLIKACVRIGLNVFTFRSYPTEVRGGSVMYQARICSGPALSQGDRPEFLAVFSKKELENNQGDLAPDGVILVDAEAAQFAKAAKSVLPTPISELSRRFGADRRNMAVLGVCARYLGVNKDVLQGLLQERYAKRDEALKMNVGAFEAGWDFCGEKGWRHVNQIAPALSAPARLLLSGNEAISLGAIVAGCRFFAGYPITPASEILEYLSETLPRFGGRVLQVEDEMAALAAVIGASFTGTKAMTATSGPGFSLMGELIGYASMAEVPCVIVDSQRVGPSTGIPTATEQSDLLLAVHASHGESPRIVLAPSSVEDCFYMTIEAFNLAEECQMPVILLADLALSHRLEAVPALEMDRVPVRNRLIPDETALGEYRRFRVTETGVSPMAIPGQNGMYAAMGIEHDERGFPSYTPETRLKMTEKRFRKLAQVDANRFVRTFGDTEASTGIIGWGSTEGVIMEAVDRLAKEGLPVHGMQLKMLWPLPVDPIMKFLEWKKNVFVAELNRTGQCARLIRSELGISTKAIDKYIGLPFTAGEIADHLRGVTRNG